ncbi:MAG: hypothetical protein JXX28_00325 [Deltaproteobacteria bacterium]|nr:hypothetical protein [Deltaproteobacteria bacterium]
MLPLWTLLSSFALGADCSQPVSPQTLDADAQDAMLAFALMDDEAFLDTAAKVFEQLGCADRPLPSNTAATMHRLKGMRAFFLGDGSTTLLAFRAAQHIQPDYTLSARIAPEGGKLWRSWDAAAHASSPGMIDLRVAPGYSVLVDGTAAAQRPAEFPSIVQIVDPAGALLWTGLLDPQDPLPWYALRVSLDAAVEQPAGPAVEPVAEPEVALPVVAEAAVAAEEDAGEEAAAAQVAAALPPQPPETRPQAEERPAVQEAVATAADVLTEEALAEAGEPPTALDEDAPPPSLVEQDQPPALAVVTPPSAPEISVQPPGPPAPVPPPAASAPARKSIPSGPTAKSDGPHLGGPLASALVAGALYGGAALARTQFDAEPSRELFLATNGATIGSAVFSALTVGLTVNAFMDGGK